MKIYCYNPKADFEYSYYITKEVFLWDFPISFINNSYCPEHISHRKLSKYTNRQKEILRRLSEKEIK